MSINVREIEKRMSPRQRARIAVLTKEMRADDRALEKLRKKWFKALRAFEGRAINNDDALRLFDAAMYGGMKEYKDGERLLKEIGKKPAPWF